MTCDKHAAILAALDARTDRLRVATDGLRQVVARIEDAGVGGTYLAHDPASDALLIARDTLRKIGES